MKPACSVWRVLLPILVVPACSNFLGGCAFTDRHVNLAPPTVMPQIAVPASTSASHRTVSIARPQDLRPDPTTVGNIRNGYGMVTAQVRSNNDIPLWVTNSVIAGLEQAGFRVERVETVETAHTPVAIDIAVSRVFTEHAPGFFTLTAKGDVAAQIEVYKQGKRILRRTYAGKYEDPEFFVTTSSSEYQTLLDAAMKDFLQKAIPDLTGALSQALDETSHEGEPL